jgi:amino-acid N-acetyltransferase
LSSGPSTVLEAERVESAERKEAKALLVRCNLPLAGLDQAELWCVKGGDGHLLAVAGLETWGSQTLLRSVAVEDENRGLGIGSLLVAHVLKAAKSKKAAEVYLLTETAPLFFRELGFKKFARSRVKGAILGSSEFRGACPESARVMRLVL